MPRVLRPILASILLASCADQQASIAGGCRPVAARPGTGRWTEFLSRIYQVPGKDLFVVDGDSTIEGWKNLHEFYERAVIDAQALIIDQSGGVDARWSDSQKLELRYCVSTDFGGRHASAVAAIAEAASAWSAAAQVEFIHQASADEDCTSFNDSVLFDVRPVQVNGQFLARAFFPGASRDGRTVAIDECAFSTSGTPTLTGLLRHELGHVLGFRHEHTRPEAGSCFEDSDWRELTPYDSASVMHYPVCNGSGDATLSLTARDIDGARRVYGEPGHAPARSPLADLESQSFTGTIARGGWASWGPFSARPGTTLTAVLEGVGDPDLYVRFGAAPTATQFTCRPHLDGPDESCNLSVPAALDDAYLSIYGDAASSYSATISWTPR